MDLSPLVTRRWRSVRFATLRIAIWKSTLKTTEGACLTVISIPELRFSIRRFLLYMDLRVGFDPNEHLKVK